MDGYLRQSTASQTRWIGPYLDSTDMVTAESALTIANTDIRVSKNGGASANKNSGGGTHDVNGNYVVTWNATDTDTLGELKYSSKVSGALQVFGSYSVISASAYDAMFASTGAVPLHGISDMGTAQSATSTTLVLRAAAVFGDDAPLGGTLWAFGSTQGYWQFRPITDYVLSTDTATVPTWNVTPSGTITYIVFGTAPAATAALTATDVWAAGTRTLTSGGGGLDAAATRAALGLASANLDTQLGDLPTNAELVTAVAAGFTTTLADSVPADGTRPTPAQALYMLTQFMSERSISGTTCTVKKVDGSTTLMTFTLNSATTPTSITRTT